MKTTKKIIGISVLVAVIGLLIFGAVNRTLAKSEESTGDLLSLGVVDEVYGNGNGTGNGSGESGLAEEHAALTQDLTSSPLGELSQDEMDALLFMHEEEKLARDVYTYLAEVWGLPSFSNIAASEQAHMDSVLNLLERYGLTDAASEQAGIFTNPDLQSLYAQLIEQGSLSVEEAFMVGAAIEEIDILDLQERLAQTDQSDIQQVFESLLNGSYKHLSAFVGNLEKRYGIVYVPQYLSQEAYASILVSSDGTGGSGFGGGGNGRP